MADLPVRVEVVPADGLAQRLRASLPVPAVLTVTCLPHHGPREAVEVAVDLAAAGYTVIPHLAARSVPDRAELARYVAQCRDAGITDVFVIGGDASTAAGPYAWSGALMEDIADLSGGALRMGIAVYPEGHPGTAEDELARTLRAKQELASWCVTQLCFSPDTLHAYPSRLLHAGITLPVWAGVPGPVRMTRLFRLATTIGVGQSLGFLRRSAGGTETGSVVRQLISSASYDPAPLVAALDGAGYAGLHLYSFNDLAALAASGLTRSDG
ncbi:methylenetetrahydrofolate reductase [Arthrobacter agilis]|uniref:methylenetetrahydrofolate reductase n=1 Tax=Arthrobacter agilis TaxID=37921 RepID=UPI0027858411|nr:methylenetetrahydrofolate reductase [Arthrobacter agilis]MDQ0736622.1 methylenetetrahydrofolate reductase (NADPH) [Arthrobacter agilis]